MRETLICVYHAQNKVEWRKWGGKVLHYRLPDLDLIKSEPKYECGNPQHAANGT